MTEPRPSAKRHRQRGITLVESVVFTAVSSLAIAGLVAFTSTSVSASRVATARARLEQDAARVLRNIVRELLPAGRSSITPLPAAPFGTSSLSYRKLEDFDSGLVDWGDTSRLEFQYDPQDADDGLDNDADGLVDEGQIVLVENAGLPNERRRLVALGVTEYLLGETPNGIDDNDNGLIDERGFSIESVGDSLVVRFTLARPGPGGQVLTRTVDTSITPRN